MILFHNMTSVAIYTTITVMVLLWYATAVNPLRIGGLFLKQLAVSRSYLLHFVALLTILFINKVELKFEANMSTSIADYASLFQSIEGNFVLRLQQLFEHDVLTAVLSFIYIVVFQAMLIASVGIYTFEDPSQQKYRAICYAIMLNYLVAIPFYLFFPVNEVWYHDPNVSFLMLKVFPAFETEYRALSGINNCFPSLHTSISVTLAVLAIRSGNKKWAWFCSICAAVVIFSIFYLGIHWVIDMFGGLVLGLLASFIGLKLSKTEFVFFRKRSKNRRLQTKLSYASEDAAK